MPLTYTLLLLLYASSNLPYSALSGVITGNMKERNSISSFRFVAVMFAQFFVQVFMLPIIIYAGEGDKAVGIEIVMTWLAIIGTILLLITFFTTKERVIPKKEQESTLREDFADLISNKPWVIMLILTTLTFISLAMKGGSYVYYFENFIDVSYLTNFISPILEFLSSIGINFFGNDPVSAGFGLFNAGGIIFMIIGIGFRNLWQTSMENEMFLDGFYLSQPYLFFFLLPETHFNCIYFWSSNFTWFFLWNHHSVVMGYDC